MIKEFIASCCILLCAFLHAQGENNIWYFGMHAGLDFNSGTPVPLVDGQIDTSEGCAVMSDPTGALLFYTDGTTVWDRDHVQMPNGFDLHGGSSSTQSALIVPVGSTGTYYIFTAEEVTTSTKRFSYSLVDISLNGGYGDVTLKNILLMTPATEQLAATRTSDGSGIWVMTHSSLGNSFHAWPVTPAAIGEPVVSTLGQSFNNSDGVGQLKFSPDGIRLAVAAWGAHFVEVFDFNATTGIVSNVRHLFVPPSFNNVYGLEFSPSGERLYAADINPGQIFQWDLSSADQATINASRTTVSPGNDFSRGHLQLAPDGKIYIADNGSGALGVINVPEALGSACDVVESGISLGGMNSRLGLPNVIHGSGHFPTSVLQPAARPLHAWPTFFSDRLIIGLDPRHAGEAKLFVRNTTGQLVHVSFLNDASGITSIDLGELPNGTYAIECVHRGDRYSARVIKQ